MEKTPITCTASRPHATQHPFPSLNAHHVYTRIKSFDDPSSTYNECDEIQPHCRRCTSVNIQCYFGQRPAWIQDRRLGKEELERIKPTIAASATRKRAAFREKSKSALQTSPLRSPGVPRLGEKEPHQEDERSDDDDGLLPMEVNYESALRDGEGLRDDRALHEALPLIQDTSPRINTLSPGSIRYDHNPRPASSGIIKSPSSIVATPQSTVEAKEPKDFGGDEPNLMMHYLDNVFYIQFRFFTPSVKAGGRGWLLSLLYRTKPLYHAAISLSAFHQQSLISQQGADQAQMDYLHQLELHHNLTLEELQLFIHAHTENTDVGGGFGGKVQILACMVQLISFELFNGGTGKWQVHLGAASKLILEIQAMRDASIESSSQDPMQGMDMKDVSRPNIAAFNFFATVIIWFDVVACVSTGSQPHLVEHHSKLLFPPQSPDTLQYDTTFQLERIMGCQNWAIVLIGEIAVLAHAHQEARLDSQKLASTAKDIQSRLEFHLSQTLSSLHDLQREYGGPPPHYLLSVYTHYTTLAITRVFASAAFIYLQTVITALPTIFHIQEPLQDVMSAMSLIPDPRMVRGMIWPLCVAGCMASSPADQQFFRERAEGAVNDAGLVGNSGKAMEILEMSWELQRSEGRLVDCATCVRNLGTCVLLA